MRTLVLSIGNTSVSGDVFSKGKSVAIFRLPLAKVSSTRGVTEHLLPRVRGKIDQAVLCSVVPKLTPVIVKQITKRFGIVASVLTADSIREVKINYRAPRELGTDRIAAALGAREVVGARDVIVVDCGTATTVTALRRDGTILGGAIFPGLGLWSAMLASRTAQLPAVPLRRPAAAVGRSTRESLQSGIFHGHAGAVRELVRQITREAFGGKKTLVFGTGGNAPWLASEAVFSHIIPNLVLIGLARFGKVEAAQPL
jgi:type III pantothenate kinase